MHAQKFESSRSTELGVHNETQQGHRKKFIRIKMAALGGALLSSVLQKSPAEKALSPWWDRVQDYITYGMIILCKLILILIYEYKNSFQ